MTDREQYLREWAADRGMDETTVAHDLSVFLGREIKPGGVKFRWNSRLSKLPKTWAEALGIPQPAAGSTARDEAPGVEAESETSRQRRRQAEHEPPPPRPPLHPVDLGDLEQRIAGLYVLVGKGVGHATHDARYTMVFEQHAGQAGKAWADLARADERVARFLNGLMIGGPWSGVVICHLSLGMALVMISGRVNVFGNTAGQQQPAQAPPPAGRNGAADTEDSLGHPGSEADFGMAPG